METLLVLVIDTNIEKYRYRIDKIYLVGNVHSRSIIYRVALGSVQIKTICSSTRALSDRFFFCPSSIQQVVVLGLVRIGLDKIGFINVEF